MQTLYNDADVASAFLACHTYNERFTYDGGPIDRKSKMGLEENKSLEKSSRFSLRWCAISNPTVRLEPIDQTED